MIFSLLSSLCCLLVAASFIAPWFANPAWCTEAEIMTAASSFEFYAILYLFFLALVQSTLQGIFQAALYAYARRGLVHDCFDAEMLREKLGRR